MTENERNILRTARSLLEQGINRETGQLADMNKINESVESAIFMYAQMYGQPDCDADDLVNALRQEFTITQGAYTILTDEGTDHKEWWTAKRNELEESDGLPYWERYKLHLSDSISQTVVAKLDRLTDDILGRIENPNRTGSWDRRGLVVGQVQSGKTSNYTGLICKAVDAGYKLVIVLAGMHNNLRAQTQLRLDEGFLGFDTSMALRLEDNVSSKIGVGLGSLGRVPNPAISLTTNSENGDFKTSRANNAGIPLGGSPVILVVKKNKGVLENLINWIKSREGSEDEDGNTHVANVPMLLIDDEADNASVNAATKPGQVAAINGKVREILKLMRQSSYVGYTATPFANVFIEPSDESDAVSQYGKDIYPEHFIVNIKAPSNYFGPLRVFGLRNDEFSSLEEQEALPLVNNIDTDEFNIYFPPRHKKDLIVEGLPSDLEDAVMSFILTIAARRVRGQKDVHNSMLVHISLFQAVQDQIKELLQDRFDAIKNCVLGSDPSTLQSFKYIWDNDFCPTTIEMQNHFSVETVTWDQVRGELASAVRKVLPVKAINGSAKDTAEYSKNPQGISVICVGGNKLARGLTLEGLSVSYFTRPARMYDTLMQMGRWFGYRSGYEDLCRLYTTRHIERCFEHITLASEELRQQFNYMMDSGRTPRDYGNMVRTSPHGMLITALSKMRSSTTMDLSFADHLIELSYYSRDARTIKFNYDLTNNWLRGLGNFENRERSGVKGFCWETSADEVVEYLKKYNSPNQAWRAKGDTLAKYIIAQKNNGRLENWIVAVLNPGRVTNRFSQNIAGINEIGMFERSDAQSSYPDMPYTLPKSRLGSRPDEGIGLTEQQWDQSLELTRASSEAATEPSKPSPKAMRRLRGADGGTGLLMLYLLDYHGEHVEGDLPPVGYAVSFPPLSGDTKISYQVSQTWLQSEFDYEEPEEDDD